jgi:hypothetical protein
MYSFKYFTSLLLLCSFLSCDEPAQTQAESESQPSEAGQHYGDQSARDLQQLLQSYYRVKDALVASDSLRTKEAASTLAAAMDSLQFHADTSLQLASLSFPSIIKEAAINLHKTTALEEQRAVFETISDNLYELIKALKPAGMETYKQYCPMAFNDKGAYWLSDTSQIQNPYFGKKMLICGEVQEELRYK